MRLTYFDARFDSECDSCDEPIEQGERIARTDSGDYLCGSCVEEIEEDEADTLGSV